MLLLGHWLLASDLHVEPGSGAPVPAYYGSDTNWALLDSTVAAMRRADPNPQVVILSGDFLAHHFPHNAQLAESTMARIVRTFNAAFPRAQFVIVPGNNDDPCGDYRVTPGLTYFAHLAHMWAPLVNRNGTAPSFESDFAQHGWYTATLPNHLRAMAIDSVYWSIVYRACTSIHPDASLRELGWLVKSLDTLPSHTRAMLVMHIPPGVDPQSTLVTHRLLVVSFWQAQFQNAFVSAIQKRDRHISFAIAGHTHRDDFRFFGGMPILIAPSVSPVYHNNPAFLRLDVAPDGTLQNYTMFDYDLLSQQWEQQDSFDRIFGVNAFSQSALASIHARLSSDKDLRRTWARFFMSGSGDREVTSATWRTYWCAQSDLAATYIACAGLQRRVELLPIAAGVVIVGIVALLAIAAVRLGRQRRRV